MEKKDENIALLEVDEFLNKLDSLPQGVKEAALVKLQEKLKERTKNTESQYDARIQNDADSNEEIKSVDQVENIENGQEPLVLGVKVVESNQISEEFHVTEYILEDFLTMKGRKAKRISYNPTMVPHNSVKKVRPRKKLQLKKHLGRRRKRKDSSKNYDSVSESTEETESYLCERCGFSTTSTNELQHHLHNHNVLVCAQCDKRFLYMSGYTLHMKRHKGQRDFPCDQCDYRAFTKVDKIRHMSVHTGEKNQICQYCGKAFAKDSTLREHVKYVHERKSAYVCTECGFKTYRMNNLRVHIHMRHKGEYNNHVCPICGAKVKQKSAFLEHMKAHSGDKPYKCDQCSSSFACPARLTVHQKTVHAPRQFTCEHCGKNFQTKYHLARHEVIHTKEKPFSCPFCSYSCNTQGNITKHIKNVHGKADFSYRKYKEEQRSGHNLNYVKEEWVQKGKKVGEEYVKKLSEKLGRDVTLEDLKKQDKKRKQVCENGKIGKSLKGGNLKNLPAEHSYHQNRDKELGCISKPSNNTKSVDKSVLGKSSCVSSGIGKSSLGESEQNSAPSKNDLLPHIQDSELDVVNDLQAILPIDENLVNVSQVCQLTSDQSIRFCLNESISEETFVPYHVIYQDNSSVKSKRADVLNMEANTFIADNFDSNSVGALDLGFKNTNSNDIVMIFTTK